MIVILRCTMTLKALLLFGALALTVYLLTVAEALKDSKTQAATACLGAKPKQDSAKTFKSLIQKTGSGGGFGRAQFQLLSVRLHVNWIY